MGIDPTAALAVNICAAPGAFAFLLGSGVSAPAGIPTGRELLLKTCEQYYRAHTKREVPKGLDLADWTEDSIDVHPITYSAILEAIFAEPDAHRDYLDSFFKGKGPTAGHRALASMVKEGHVKVLVTTNFDSLLELALRSEDVAFTKVSSAEELVVARPRELSRAYVLKLHGDHTSSRIRNTASELEQLDPDVEDDFRRILQVHGLVIVGYACQDPGVQRILRSERARYGVYWVMRDPPSEQQRDLANSLDARIVEGLGADAFFADLADRVRVLAAQPDGLTAEQRGSQVTDLIAQGRMPAVLDQVDRLLRRLWHGAVVFAGAHRDRIWSDDAAGLEGRWNGLSEVFGPIVDEYLAAATALGRYDTDALAPTIRQLVRLSTTELPGHGYEIAKSGVTQAVACMAGHGLLVAALAAEAWRMFCLVSSAPDPGEDGTPWMMTKQLHHLEVDDRDVFLVSRHLERWLSGCATVRSLIHPDESINQVLMLSNLLLSVGAGARGVKQPPIWWSYACDHRRLEQWVRRLAFDDEMAEGLSAATGKIVAATDFRRLFAQQYVSQFNQHRRLGVLQYGLGSALSEEVLRLLRR